MNIGYVGLGNMGGPLARRLQLTHPLTVYDLSLAAVSQTEAAGSKSCARLSDLASKCDVIFLCLPTTDHVRTAIFGEEGLGAGLKAGTLIVDQTSGDPVATRKIAAELAARDVELIDAPVSGGAQGANAGTIAIMVGATNEQYERILPILSAISKNLFHAGPIGSGQVIKLVNNMISGAQRLITLEGVALAVKNGLDAKRACEILLSGGAKNAFMEKFMVSHIIQGNLDVGFTMGLMHKDMRLACQLGSDSNVPLLFGNLAREFYQICINSLGREAQVHAAAVVMDELAGTHVVPVAATHRQ